MPPSPNHRRRPGGAEGTLIYNRRFCQGPNAIPQRRPHLNAERVIVLPPVLDAPLGVADGLIAHFLNLRRAARSMCSGSKSSDCIPSLHYSAPSAARSRRAP